MLKVWQQTRKRQEPLLILGEGSNVLFPEDFSGTVMVNQLKGIDVREDSDARISTSAPVRIGMIWCNIRCRQDLWPENPALIPRLAGSAPIQNIGAYGVELKDVCEYVDLLDFYRRYRSHSSCRVWFRLPGKYFQTPFPNRACHCRAGFTPQQTVATQIELWRSG